MMRITIRQLTELVGQALATIPYRGTGSARVRDVPDLRTIRYYTTLGLLDKPAEMRGRTALYGRRHLLQLVAIKQLQAEGLSLTAVQERLSGASDKQLARWASLPADFWEQAEETREPAAAAPTVQAAVEKPAARQEAFWSQPPAESSAPPRSAGPSTTLKSLTQLPLAAGVTLLLEDCSGEELDEEVLTELHPLMKDVLEVLKRAGWRQPSLPYDSEQASQEGGRS